MRKWENLAKFAREEGILGGEYLRFPEEKEEKIVLYGQNNTYR